MNQPGPQRDFRDEADRPSLSLVAEFWLFLRQEKKWWLIPVLISFLLIAALIALGTSPVTAPFIYTLW